MTPSEIEIYNSAAQAAIDCDRARLAQALRQARASERRMLPYRRLRPETSLPNRILYHVTFVGWPVRRRPNGSHT